MLGKTVTSEDFDIRLMILLLRTLANLKVGDIYYPVQADTSVGAMLSRIKFVRNAATQKLDGKISKNQFNKYWNDIGQVNYLNCVNIILLSFYFNILILF